jgi:hypothetical protein
MSSPYGDEPSKDVAGHATQLLKSSLDVDGMSWYAFGDIVVDRIIGTHRASYVNVFFRGLPPDRERVIDVLGIEAVPLRLTDQPPTAITNLDRFIINPEGTLQDLYGERISIPSEVHAMEFEIGARDLIRLWHLHLQYPELSWEERLWTRIKSDFDHLQLFADRSPELKLMLTDFDL